jgi:3-deoxy-D-manno-octulosonic-acid transferase
LILSFYGVLVRLMKLTHVVLSPFSSRFMAQNIDRYKQFPPIGLKVWFVASSLGESKIIENIWNLDGEINECNSLSILQTPWALKSMLSSHPKGYFRLNPFDDRNTWRDWIYDSNPDCIYMVEGELWPNLLLECQLNQVKVRWVSALMTEKTIRRWSFLKRLFYKLLKDVEVNCVNEATHFFLTERKVQSRKGISLKPLSICSNHSDLIKLNQQFEVACVSWHFDELLNWGEKIMALKCSKIIQLRHLDELSKFVKWFAKHGQKYTLWPKITPDYLCIVCEFGLTSLVVENSNLILMGGSFAEDIGVHNVLEPLSLGKKVWVGPHIEACKFKEWEGLFKKELVVKVASSFEEATMNQLPIEEVLEEYQKWRDLERLKQKLEWSLYIYEKEDRK